MNEHDIERCEAYLNGGMDPAQRNALEQRLTDDAVFAAEFAAYRDAFNLVLLAGEDRLKARLVEIHAEHAAVAARAGRVIPIDLRRLLAIAASVLVLVAGAWFLLARDRGAQGLYAEHFTPYPAPDLMRSGDADSAQAWQRFSESYAAARYDEARTILGTVANDRIPAYLVAFYRGQCQLLERDPDPRAAIASFNEVLANRNDLNLLAHWYCGLAALRIDDRALAREHFSVLAKPGMYKADEAQAILGALGDP